MKAVVGLHDISKRAVIATDPENQKRVRYRLVTWSLLACLASFVLSLALSITQLALLTVAGQAALHHGLIRASAIVGLGLSPLVLVLIYMRFLSVPSAYRSWVFDSLWKMHKVGRITRIGNAWFFLLNVLLEETNPQSSMFKWGT